MLTTNKFNKKVLEHRLGREEEREEKI